MKADEVRGLSADQLKDKLADLKKEQFNLRFQKATGQSRSPRASTKSARTSPALKPLPARRRQKPRPKEK